MSKNQITFLSKTLAVLLLVVSCGEKQKSTTNDEDPEAISASAILVFTKTAGYRHASIEKGVAVLTELGGAHQFTVTQTENAGDFSLGNLQRFDLVIFLSTTLDVLDTEQERAFKSYINQGGSFMGIHAAADTEYDWPWYGKLVGAYFKSHPEQQEASIRVLDQAHPATRHLGGTWKHFDEWYNYKDMNPDVSVLMQLDESTYSGGENGANHPIAWYHEYDGGRAFYTGLGHTEESFDDPLFRAHLVGGITYCLGRE